MSNLTQRILVALVAIPLLVVVCMIGGYYFFAIVVFISSLGLHEYYKLVEKKGTSPQIALGLVFGFLVSCIFLPEKLELFAFSMGVEVPVAKMSPLMIIPFLFFVPLIILIELFRNKGSAAANTATTVFGVCYVPLFLGSLVGVRELFAHNDGWGGAMVITVFSSIWMCDSLAYFVGRFFGKHKLFERVSPKKTWEGASAGYVGAVAAFLISQNSFLPFMTVGNAFVCGSLVGIFGQLGDLVESLLKRDAGVKDSSALIPGHGGVLDRFDSLIFVSPPMFLYLKFIVL